MCSEVWTPALGQGPPFKVCFPVLYFFRYLTVLYYRLIIPCIKHSLFSSFSWLPALSLWEGKKQPLGHGRAAPRGTWWLENVECLASTFSARSWLIEADQPRGVGMSASSRSKGTSLGFPLLLRCSGLIHSLDRHLLITYYISATLLAGGDAARNKTKILPYIFSERYHQTQKKISHHE